MSSVTAVATEEDGPADRWPSTGDAPRVAFLLPGLSAGGAERVVSILANRLAAIGWRITVVTLANADAPSYYAFDPAVSLCRLGLPPKVRGPVAKSWAVLARIVRLRRAFRQIEPDTVVSFLTRTNVLALMALTGTGVPVIVSERNNPELQMVGPIWSWFRGWFYPRAFGLVTITQGAMDWYPRSTRQRQWVIANPVEPPAPVAHQRSTTKTMTAVGRLVPQKGFDRLLEAWARIATGYPDWKLVIWGEGPERQALEAQCVRLGIVQSVSLPGVTQRPGAWVEQSDVFVLPSRYEGWGNVLAEAMAAGLPSISFDCRWGPAVLIESGVNGLLVPDGDVAALAEALRRMMADAALRMQLGAAARQSMDRFSPAMIVSQWKEAIESAIKAGRNRKRCGSELALNRIRRLVDRN